jgi:hypothetical protein
MKADDSCRVENAGVKPRRCAAQASFCLSTQSQVTVSRKPKTARAIGKVCLFLRTILGNIPRNVGPKRMVPGNKYRER